MSSCDDDWEQFLLNDDIVNIDQKMNQTKIINCKDEIIPKCSDIYISTKTMISYLNGNIDLNENFWKIPVLNYNNPIEGVVKKQIKFNNKTQEEVDDIAKRLEKEEIFNNQIISSINNPENNKIKFKDVRKITIGLSKKDITSHRCKEKSAFYNCFVLIIRLKINGVFKECHTKIFNTGKIELPGIQSDITLYKLLDFIINILKDCGYKDIMYLREKTETVLINSNFNCGYYINRDKLYDILRDKYRFHTLYDPCSYPGIMSKFYYDPTLDKSDLQTGIKTRDNKEKQISFMIFRTGSVLIVGKCLEPELIEIYEFLKKLLSHEYKIILQGNGDDNIVNLKTKKKKTKKIKRKITVIDNFS